MEISGERPAKTPPAYEIAMCSGCFGEYEGAEGFERSAAASEQGIEEGANNGGRSVWHRPSHEEFEILVSADQIVEVRCIWAGRPSRTVFLRDVTAGDEHGSTGEHC